MTRPQGRARWVGLALGLPVMLFGIGGALAHADATRPVGFATWLVGADVLHDALVAPAVGLGGWLLTRYTPRFARAPLGVALATSLVLVAIAWAPLHGDGRLPDNGSLQPLDYSTSVATALAIVWVACALWAGQRAVSSRRRRARTPTATGESP